MDPNIQITFEMVRDDQLGIIAGSHCKCMVDFISLLQWTRFISGCLHLRSLLTTILHMQFWRVNWTPVNGFSKEVHLMGGSKSLAFSGSKGNVNFLSKFVNLYVIHSLSSWLWENHFKVDYIKIFSKLNWFLFSQFSNNSQYSPQIQFCYCIFLFWWQRLTDRFPAAW